MPNQSGDKEHLKSASQTPEYKVMKIYLNQGNKETGPFSLKGVKEMLAQEKLTGDVRARHGEKSKWLGLGEIEGIKTPEKKHPSLLSQKKAAIVLLGKTQSPTPLARVNLPMAHGQSVITSKHPGAMYSEKADQLAHRRSGKRGVIFTVVLLTLLGCGFCFWQQNETRKVEHEK